MTDKRQRLTDEYVRNLPLPKSGQKIYWDAPGRKLNDYVAGFGIRLTAGGARVYILNYRTTSGRDGRLKIGPVGEYSAEAARRVAREQMAAIRLGADPAREVRELRQADDVNELCDRFITEHVERKRPATAIEYKGIIDKYVRPALGTKKVADVNPPDIDKLHRKISEHAPYRANRCVAVLSKMFNLAVRWRLRGDNPVKGVEKNAESSRKRYLTPEELKRLAAALKAYRDQRMANYFRLLLLCGSRAGETLMAQFSEFDLRAGTWTKPSAHTMQKTEHVVPLSIPALQLLEGMYRQAKDKTGRLFPGATLDQRQDAWTAICKAASIENLRAHDLRHSFASAVINSGQRLEVVGALLGHTQAQTTHRYAHLYDDVTRAATNRAAAQMAGLVAKPRRKPLKVIARGKGG
jgi:integrase